MMLAFNMSLTYFLLNNFTPWRDAYECPRNPLGSSWEPPPHFSLSVYFTVSGSIQTIFYAIISATIFSRLIKYRTARNQLMFLLSLLDIAQIYVNSFITGLLGLRGVSFCDYPTTVFLSGAIGNGAWMMSCPVTILFGLERVVEVRNSRLDVLFEGRRFVVIQTLLALWGVYCFFIANPAVFLAKYNAWVFDPMIGRDPALYRNYLHTVVNCGVSFSMILLGGILWRSLRESKYATSPWLYKNNPQIVTQCLWMSISHAATGLLYEIMQFVQVPELFVVGQIAWQWTSASMPFVYLFFNRTIRREFIEIYMPIRLRQKLGIPLYPEEHQKIFSMRSSIQM